MLSFMDLENIKQGMKSIKGDIVGHGFLALSLASGLGFYAYNGGSRFVEGILGGLAAGGVLMAGEHYRKMHSLNKKYSSLLDNVNSAEQLERLDSVFDDVGRGKLGFGKKIPWYELPSYKFTRYLYRRQREENFGN